MTHGIGIQICQDKVIVAVVTQNTRLCVIDLVTILGNLYKIDTQKHLNTFFHTHLHNEKRVVLSVPTHTAILRKFTVPFTAPNHIELILASESERYIPSRAIEELIVDFNILSTKEQNTRLLVAAVPKKIISQTIFAMESCAIYPFAIDLDILGLLYTWQAVPQSHNHQNVALLSITHNVCHILLLANGQISEARALRIYVSSLMDGINSNFQDTTELQIAGTQKTEAPQISLNSEEKARICKRLVQELRRTVFNAPPLDGIYLTGETALIEEMATLLPKELQTPAFLWNFASDMVIADAIERSNVSQAQIAIGLAIKALGNTTGGFNFRKGRLAYKQSFDIIKRPLATLLTLLFVTTSLGAFLLYQTVHAKREDYIALVKEAEKVYSRVNPEINLPTAFYQDRIYQIKELLKNQLATSQERVPQCQDTLRRWVSLFEEIAKVRKQYCFTIEHFTLGQGEVILDGRNENDLVFDFLKNKLNTLPWVDDKEDSIRVIYSQLSQEPKDPRLPRQYKVWIKVRNGGFP